MVLRNYLARVYPEHADAQSRLPWPIASWAHDTSDPFKGKHQHSI